MNSPSSLAARLDLLRMIVQRLERLSADSAWAHISSGYRGSMIKLLDRLEAQAHPSAEDQHLLDFLIGKGLELLTRAAREIGDPGLVEDLPQSSQG